MTAPRTMLLAASLLCLVAGAAWSHATPIEPELATLLRAMAVLKAATALGAAALLWWRLGQDMRPRLAASGGVAVCLMAAAAGLIWSLAHVALGAVLFHLGLVGFLVIAWRDGLPTPFLARVRRISSPPHAPARRYPASPSSSWR